MMVIVDEEEFAKSGVPAPNTSQHIEKNSISISEILSDGEKLDLTDE